MSKVSDENCYSAANECVPGEINLCKCQYSHHCADARKESDKSVALRCIFEKQSEEKRSEQTAVGKRCDLEAEFDDWVCGIGE